jgi:signal peptidase I
LATIAIIVAFLSLAILGEILILWALARLFNAPNNRWRHAVIAFVLAIPLSIVQVPAERFLLNDGNATALKIGVFWTIVLACLLLQFLIVKKTFKLSLPRSVGYFFANLICAAAFALGASAFLRTALLHPYACNKLACAPTLIGAHRVDKCPNCGGTLFVRAIEPESPGSGLDDRANDGICEKCHKFSVAKNPSVENRRPDLVISSLFLAPGRWDLVTYAPPDRSSKEQVIFVGRVVGLPGETVVIKDGAVYINGKKLSPPPGIAGIEYLATFVDREAPKQLGQDEYCVLGDFSKNSLDSRYFGAVPRKNINGVVTVCYWPPNRWRIWR